MPVLTLTPLQPPVVIDTRRSGDPWPFVSLSKMYTRAVDGPFDIADKDQQCRPLAAALERAGGGPAARAVGFAPRLGWLMRQGLLAPPPIVGPGPALVGSGGAVEIDVRRPAVEMDSANRTGRRTEGGRGKPRRRRKNSGAEKQERAESPRGDKTNQSESTRTTLSQRGL